MVHQKELRIGNWVDVGNGLMEQVVEIYPDSISTLTRNHIVDYMPIPLTPEILERAGLYRVPCGISGADMWQGMDFWRFRDKSRENIFRGYIDKDRNVTIVLIGYFNTQIKHLHQLQNLYFALTGEELNIEL